MIEVRALQGAALVVDGGPRAGHPSLQGGAFDDRALARANLALGNPCWASGLEVLLGPIKLQSESACRVAVAGGADVDIVTLGSEPLTLAHRLGLRNPERFAGY